MTARTFEQGEILGCARHGGLGGNGKHLPAGAIVTAVSITGDSVYFYDPAMSVDGKHYIRVDRIVAWERVRRQAAPS